MDYLHYKYNWKDYVNQKKKSEIVINRCISNKVIFSSTLGACHWYLLWSNNNFDSQISGIYSMGSWIISREIKENYSCILMQVF